jgi:hypothetical protein
VRYASSSAPGNFFELNRTAVDENERLLPGERPSGSLSLASRPGRGRPVVGLSLLPLRGLGMALLCSDTESRMGHLLLRPRPLAKELHMSSLFFFGSR